MNTTNCSIDANPGDTEFCRPDSDISYHGVKHLDFRAEHGDMSRLDMIFAIMGIQVNGELHQITLESDAGGWLSVACLDDFGDLGAAREALVIENDDPDYVHLDLVLKREIKQAQRDFDRYVERVEGDSGNAVLGLEVTCPVSINGFAFRCGGDGLISINTPETRQIRTFVITTEMAKEIERIVECTRGDEFRLVRRMCDLTRFGSYAYVETAD